MPTNNKNPRNPQSELFKRLTRLFSGPIINYRSQIGRKIRKQHLDKYSSRFRSASGQQFKRSGYTPFAQINTSAMSNQRRSARYTDFDQMEYTPEIASALDIYADEMTTHSALTPMLNIKCSNDECISVKEDKESSITYIKYDLENMKYIYICNHCGQKWKNN